VEQSRREVIYLIPDNYEQDSEDNPIRIKRVVCESPVADQAVEMPVAKAGKPS
jgi:hypothetical protein